MMPRSRHGRGRSEVVLARQDLLPASRVFTKLDLVEYYVRCADAVLVGVRDRPTTLKRWRDGVEGEVFFQKRVPKGAPEWLETATVTFPSGRSATELCPVDAAHLVWAANLGNIDFNPWPSRRARPRAPRRAAHRPRPDAGRSMERGARRRNVRQGRARRARAASAGRRPAARAESTSTCGSRPTSASSRCAAQRSRSPARWSAACRAARRRSGGRRSASGCSSTTTRTRATARSPAPTACARWPTRGFRAACRGTRFPTSRPRTSGSTTVPDRLDKIGDPIGGHRRAPVSARRLARPVAARRGAGPGRRAVAAELPQDARRAQARAAQPRALGQVSTRHE